MAWEMALATAAMGGTRGTSPSPVESHLANIYQKFHVRSRLGAVLKAMSLDELPTGDGELLGLGYGG